MTRGELLLSMLREPVHPALVYIGGSTSDELLSLQTSRRRIVTRRVDVGRLAPTAARIVSRSR